MCCSDLDVGARLDVLDLDPVVPPDMLVSDGGLVWMNTAGRLYVSRNEGQIFVLAYQGAECDGLTRSPFLDFSKCPPPLTNIRPLTEDEMRMFDDTPDARSIPPEKIAAARKAIDAIRARKKGLAGIEWPAGWIPSAVCPGYRIGPRDAARLPNTERGRRAAWELEGA